MKDYKVGFAILAVAKEVDKIWQASNGIPLQSVRRNAVAFVHVFVFERVFSTRISQPPDCRDHNCQ